MIKDEVKPYYGQLKSMLSQAPPLTAINTNDSELWTTFNGVIEKLNHYTKEHKYNSFTLVPIHHAGGNGFLPSTKLPISTYRAKLGGLIGFLHEEYYSNEPEPFSGTTGTIINQSQSQQQSQTIQLAVLQIQEKILQKLTDDTLKPNERDFLTKFKESLPTITNIFQLLITLVKLAKEFGVDINTLSNLII